MTREQKRDKRRREVLCERRFALWLTPSEYDLLERRAHRSGKSKAEVLKRLLRAAEGREQ